MKLLMRPEDVAECIGGHQMYLRFRDAGWIKPIERRHKLTIYSCVDVQKAVARYLIEPEKLP